MDFEVSQQQKCTLKHGSFDKTPSDIVEKTGKDNYEMEFTFSTGMKMYAVLTDNGSKIVMKSVSDPSKIEVLTWMSSQELKELIDTGDSLDSISLEDDSWWGSILAFALLLSVSNLLISLLESWPALIG